jgi:hypothetical protein
LLSRCDRAVPLHDTTNRATENIREARCAMVRKLTRVKCKDIENPPEKAVTGTVWMKILELVD